MGGDELECALDCGYACVSMAAPVMVNNCGCLLDWKQSKAKKIWQRYPPFLEVEVGSGSGSVSPDTGGCEASFNTFRAAHMFQDEYSRDGYLTETMEYTVGAIITVSGDDVPVFLTVRLTHTVDRRDGASIYHEETYSASPVPAWFGNWAGRTTFTWTLHDDGSESHTGTLPGIGGAGFLSFAANEYYLCSNMHDMTAWEMTVTPTSCSGSVTGWNIFGHEHGEPTYAGMTTTFAYTLSDGYSADDAIADALDMIDDTDWDATEFATNYTRTKVWYRDYVTPTGISAVVEYIGDHTSVGDPGAAWLYWDDEAYASAGMTLFYNQCDDKICSAEETIQTPMAESTEAPPYPPATLNHHWTGTGATIETKKPVPMGKNIARPGDGWMTDGTWGVVRFVYCVPWHSISEDTADIATDRRPL